MGRGFNASRFIIYTLLILLCARWVFLRNDSADDPAADASLRDNSFKKILKPRVQDHVHFNIFEEIIHSHGSNHIDRFQAAYEILF